MPRGAFYCQLLIGICFVFSWGLALGEQRLSLGQAIEMALKNNKTLHLEAAKVEEAQATQKSTRGLYGPKLMVEGNLMVWDSEQTFSFDFPESGPMNLTDLTKQLTPQDVATLSKYQDLLTVFPKLMPLFFDMDLGNIRDQVTGQLQVSLAQPLTPLLQIHNGYVATKQLARAAALDRSSMEVEVSYRVSEAYLRLMQASSFAKVAKTGVEQVEGHLKRAKHFYTAGLIGKQDVLKAQLELARARERLIKARYSISMANSVLNLKIGLSLEEQVTPTETIAKSPPAFSMALGTCIRRAKENRKELDSMAKKAAAAEAGRRGALWEMLPQVSAVATYQHTRGQGTFFQENAFFVGGILQWDVWDWGNKYYKTRAASAKTRQAQIASQLLRDGILLQTKKAYLDLQQSKEALTVATAAIKEAEENYRIEQRRFEANANTSTDVLDAQFALTRAKLSYTTSLYNFYIARAALVRAMGER